MTGIGREPDIAPESSVRQGLTQCSHSVDCGLARKSRPWYLSAIAVSNTSRRC